MSQHKIYATTSMLQKRKQRKEERKALPPLGNVAVCVVVVFPLPSLKTLSMSEAKSLLTLRRHGVVKEPDIVALSELLSLLTGLLKTEYLLNEKKIHVASTARV